MKFITLYLYYSIGDHKLGFYPKKQTTVTPKDHSALATTNPPTSASKKTLGKIESKPLELCTD